MSVSDLPLRSSFQWHELCFISPGSLSTCVLSVCMMHAFRGGVTAEGGDTSASNVIFPLILAVTTWFF